MAINANRHQEKENNSERFNLLSLPAGLKILEKKTVGFVEKKDGKIESMANFLLSASDVDHRATVS